MSNKVDYYLEIYPTTLDVNGRNFLVDTLFLPSSRGLIKVFEIILCFIAMLLIASSQGVEEERSFGLFVSFLGLSCSFSLLVAYVLMLNSKMSQLSWFIIECIYYVIMTILLLVAGIGMAVFCAGYWSSRNPVWSTVPSLAAGTLFVATLVFIVDLLTIIRYFKRYTWRPSFDYSAQSVPTNKSTLPTN